MVRAVRTRFTLLLISFVAHIAQADDIEIVQTRLQTMHGQLTELGQQGRNISVRVLGKKRTIPLNQLVRLGYVPHLTAPCIIFSDGSRLSGDLLQMTPDELTLQSQTWDKLRVPMKHVAGIVSAFPARIADRDRTLSNLTKLKGTRDVFKLANGDLIRGNFQAGKLIGRGKKQRFIISLQLAGLTNQLRLEQIAWLRLNPALVEYKKATDDKTIALGTSCGSLLQIRSWRSRGENLQVALACGMKLTASKRYLISQTTYLQPLGTVSYLSDLSPYGFRHIPFLNHSSKLGIDRSCQGTHLRCQGHRFLKGLGMHSYSRVAFDLGGRFQQFHAELAMDETSGKRGSVIYRVFLNDGKTWRIAFQSPVVRGGQKPRPIRLQLRGAQKMALIVDYADRGDVLDRANWLDARLLK